MSCIHYTRMHGPKRKSPRLLQRYKQVDGKQSADDQLYEVGVHMLRHIKPGPRQATDRSFFDKSMSMSDHVNRPVNDTTVSRLARRLVSRLFNSILAGLSKHQLDTIQFQCCSCHDQSHAITVPRGCR